MGPNSWDAKSREPWLRIDLGAADLPAGRWIQLRYRAGELADSVRPVLRIARAGGQHDDCVLPGPVAGSAYWTGNLPADVIGLAISPVASEGPFAFALDAVTVLSRTELVLGAFMRRPGQTLGLIYQRLRGRKLRSRHLIASIWATTPMSRYAAWQEARAAPQRLPEAAPPAESGPAITVLVELRPGDPAALEATLASLVAQDATHWAAWVVGPLGPKEATILAAAAARRPAIAAEARAAEAALADPSGPGWIGAIAAGDTLSPRAIASLAHAIRRHRDPDLVYTDEDRGGLEGERTNPVLQPDWSPRLHLGGHPPAGFVLVRAPLGAVVKGGDGPLADRLRDAALARPAPRVVHLRRILLHRAGEPPQPNRPVPTRPAEPKSLPGIAVVIPSRDRLELLSRCVEGLRSGTDYPSLEIVVVDNGSEADETRRYYAGLRDDPRVAILDRPGPFNFSALTNAGVAASRSELVLLLNNDIEVIEPGWLRRLVAEAQAPGIGAVGPKLLYPDRRVQHTGVVIGLGGAAGHLYRGREDRPPGWMARLSAPHEVSAVTAACLLVPRAHYEAVGGLDEVHLPVSFNDIDLCLKLRAEGLRNLMVPDVVLIHHESASRGLDRDGAKQARAHRESRIFSERWLSVMRDDPYFHPALSLHRFDPELG